MYRIKDAPTEAILRDLHGRIDALRGCALSGYTAERLLRELSDRANQAEGRERGQLTAQARYLTREYVRLAYRIRDPQYVDDELAQRLQRRASDPEPGEGDSGPVSRGQVCAYSKCGHPAPPGRWYCSNGCRQAAYRERLKGVTTT